MVAIRKELVVTEVASVKRTMSSRQTSKGIRMLITADAPRVLGALWCSTSLELIVSPQRAGARHASPFFCDE